MRPAQQGAFDGLCGVYAIINALDLVGLKQPRSALHQQVFTELTLGLGAAAMLSAMHAGLEARDLLRAGRYAFSQLQHTHGVSLDIEQPFQQMEFEDAASFIDVVRRLTAARNIAVILQVHVRRWHWTVARAVVGRKMTLRDSAGLSELDLSKFTLQGGRYVLNPSETLLIQRKR